MARRRLLLSWILLLTKSSAFLTVDPLRYAVTVCAEGRLSRTTRADLHAFVRSCRTSVARLVADRDTGSYSRRLHASPEGTSRQSVPFA